MGRTYWQNMVSDTARSRDAIRQWVSPLCDDLSPYEVHVLCDIETDAELGKMRVYASGDNGETYLITRSKTKAGYSLARKPIGKRTKT